MYSNNKTTNFTKIITDLYLLLPTTFTEWNAQEKRDRLFNLELSVSLLKLKFAILSHYHYLTNNGVNVDSARSGEIACNFTNKSTLHKMFKSFAKMVEICDTHFDDEHVSIDFDTERKVLIYTIKDQYLSDIEGAKGKFRINFEEIDSKSHAKISLQAFLLSQQGQETVSLKEGFIAALTANTWTSGDYKQRAQNRRNIKSIVKSISAATLVSFNEKAYTYTFKIIKRSAVEILPMAAKKLGVAVIKLSSLVKAAAKKATTEKREAGLNINADTGLSEMTMNALKSVFSMQSSSPSEDGIIRGAVLEGEVVNYDERIPF
ncbi:hypothetical protein MA785_000835 [Vibrio parahaemolyticus]|nr:hypothetical protein [Vibrio parahaemolyticus]EJR2787944.1 hypothetical protein [Vibrio parahaemolyticus]